MYDDGETEYPDGSGGHMVLMGSCIRCGNVCTGHPDTMPSVRVHWATRCPIRPDGTHMHPSDPDGSREPICPACVAFIAAHEGENLPLSVAFPHARAHLITPPPATP